MPDARVLRMIKGSAIPTGVSRRDHLKRFYALLSELEKRLGGVRRLSDCTGRLTWPKRGIYFFKESGECRQETGTGPRVVRVGTHALKAGSSSTLWSRLRQHRGAAGTGGGNQRGSIFRRLVGSAIIERDGLNYPSWDAYGQTAPSEVRRIEQPVQQAVSKVIGEMPLLWLAIEDEPGPKSLRRVIESNSIALLSNHKRHPLDSPSSTWLGHHCNRVKVRDSGLWNQQHVEDDYDSSFLDKLEHLIAQMQPPA